MRPMKRKVRSSSQTEVPQTRSEQVYLNPFTLGGFMTAYSAALAYTMSAPDLKHIGFVALIGSIFGLVTTRLLAARPLFAFDRSFPRIANTSMGVLAGAGLGVASASLSRLLPAPPEDPFLAKIMASGPAELDRGKGYYWYEEEWEWDSIPPMTVNVSKPFNVTCRLFRCFRPLSDAQGATASVTREPWSSVRSATVDLRGPFDFGGCSSLTLSNASLYRWNFTITPATRDNKILIVALPYVPIQSDLQTRRLFLSSSGKRNLASNAISFDPVKVKERFLNENTRSLLPFALTFVSGSIVSPVFFWFRKRQKLRRELDLKQYEPPTSH